MGPKIKTINVVFLGVSLSLIIFIIDLATPLGVAGGVPYVAVIMLAWWSAETRPVLFFAVFCTALTLLGFYYSPPGGEIWQVWANRFLAIFAIWTTALLSVQHRRGERASILATELGRILDNSLNEIYVFDAESMLFLQVNRGARANLGYSMAEMRDLSPLDLKPELTTDDFSRLLRPLINGERQYIVFETTHLRKDGSTYPVEVHLHLADYEARRAFVAIILDITQRRRILQELLERERQLRTIVDHAPEAVVVLDADTGKFVDANRNAERLFGLDRDALLRTGPIEMSPATQPDGRPSRSAAAAFIKASLAGDTPVFDWVHRDADNNDICCEIRLVKLPKSGSNLVRGSITDISQRMRRQEALNRAYDELEQRVQQRTAALTQSEERLRAEEQFLLRLLELQEKERQMVAHDIHDGIVQDVAGAHMLVETLRSGPNLERRDEILRRVTSILGKALAEGRRLISDLRPMVLDESGVVEAIRHLIADHENIDGFFVTFQPDVQFDRLAPRLEGAIFRIVQEALRNSTQHGQTDRAHVQMTHADGELYVEIRDDGVGFDPDNVPSERFGLRGIQERARLFDGAAVIDSAPGKGTTVRVQLPLTMMTPDVSDEQAP